MKTKFLLCMRPSVIETDDGDYTKLPSPVTPSYTVSGGSRIFRQRGKRVAPEKYIRQLSLKSNGYTSEGKSEIQARKDPQEAPKITRSVSEACLHIKFSEEDSFCLKKPSHVNISNDKVDGGPGSNLGAYLMVSSLFFTIFMGKLFGIMCTLILMCLFYHHRKNDGNGSWKPENMVVNSREKDKMEYNKRVIMDGFLERKSHYRENNKLFR